MGAASGGGGQCFSQAAACGGGVHAASYDAGVLTVRVAGAYAGGEPQRIAIK